MQDSAALRLLPRLYRAAITPPEWNRFAAELSDAMGGAAVTLAIRRPETQLGWSYFGAGSHDLAVLVAEDLQGALVRAARRVDSFRRSFVNLGEAFPRIELERNPWFREWLEPRGVEPTWPLCHAVSVDRTILCWMIVTPPTRAGFELDAATALGNQLVPHFARALSIHRDLGAESHKQRALDEVLDRLPLGMLLLDARRQVIHANMSAQRMLALDDGLSLREQQVRGDAGDADLQHAIDAALQAGERGEFDHVSHAAVPTKSGHRPFLLAVTPVMRARPGRQGADVTAVVYFSNPDALATASVQALEAVYGLTAAEAAVVRGLVEGLSMEEIAAQRQVKPDTVRSQLKQVFAKTRTSRQAELIRLVLAGVSPLSQAVPTDESGSP
jgi:DNA-binding CsgD family transcriptional regulator